jgi:hypothetical protein
MSCVGQGPGGRGRRGGRAGLQSVAVPSGDQVAFATKAAVGRATAGAGSINKGITEADALTGWVTPESSAPARGRWSRGHCCQVGWNRATTNIRSGC